MDASFSLVLHGHLPWVLHHGRWPHGEDWIYEAASSSWLPLLQVAQRLWADGIRPAWTMGLTPILLEQLSHPRFTERFGPWLAERAERARQDRREWDQRGEGHLAWLATLHEERFTELQRVFEEELGRDLVAGFRRLMEDGALELLSSNATHGYHPLLLHDSCARAQVRTGLATSARHLGRVPRGVWLPECAYRPAGPWTPPVLHGDVRDREGVARLFADEGVGYFFLDSHLFAGARSEGVRRGDHVEPVGWDQAGWDGGRGWRSVLEPHELAERGVPTGLVALARCPDVSEQVWSGEIGYPGDGRYQDFHKKHGMRGLPYWKVTGSGVDMGDKAPYYPDDVQQAVHEHAAHFVRVVRTRLERHRDHHGRDGVVCAPFDTELFGHWWHEGPRFLEEVSRQLHHTPGVTARTVGEVLAHRPVDKVVAVDEGTWGAGGDHRVWLHDGLRFYWEMAYSAEDRFLDLWHRAPWQQHAAVQELLTEAGRQLLMLQASDWPFVITTQGAVDYGTQRICGHKSRLDALLDGVEDLLAGQGLDPVAEETLRYSRLVDAVFPDLELSVWNP